MMYQFRIVGRLRESGGADAMNVFASSHADMRNAKPSAKSLSPSRASCKRRAPVFPACSTARQSM